MSKTWLFRIEVTGFPRTARIEPIEVYGGHYEWWAVLADDKEKAATMISERVYYKHVFDSEMPAAEAAKLGLTPGNPVHIRGW